MGSEQSSQRGAISQGSRLAKAHQLRRGKSVPEPKRPDSENIEVSRPGSCSPGLSVCSDSDVPYVPYTVNRPIGDSPKLAKHLNKAHTLSGASGLLSSQSKKLSLRKQFSTHNASQNIVVVKQASMVDPDNDPEIQRLQTIPTFVPIMRGTVSHPSQRDPEVLERLDPSSLYRLCLRFQTHIGDCATLTSEDQNFLCKQVKLTDTRVSQLKGDYNERLKSYKKNVEQLSKVSELTSQIAKCHILLNKALESVERLNNFLPPDERLEPFVWTTG